MNRKQFLRLSAAASGLIPIAGSGAVNLLAKLELSDSPNGRVMDRLASEPAARSEVRLERGGPRLFLNDEEIPPLLALSTAILPTVANFKRAGIKLIQPLIGMRAGWLGPDTYDFSLFDGLFTEILRRHPEAFILPRMQLNTPTWWKEAHPEASIQYGLPLNELNYDIVRKRKLPIGEGGHPFFSGRELWEASFASDQWQRDTEAMLKTFVRHIDSGPLSARVMGYFPAGGGTGEWNCYGSDFLHDYSKPMQEKVGSVPSVRERLGTSIGLLRDPEAEAHVAEYYRRFHTQMAEACLGTVKALKEAMEGRVVCGVFFAYLMETVRIQEDGFLMPFAILDAPEVDFLAGPYAYQNTNLDGNERWKSEMEDGAGNLLGQARGVGGDGAFRLLTESLRRRGKLYISEIDPSTYLDVENRWRDIGGSGSTTPEGTAKIFQRDLGKVFATGCGGWLYDFGPLHDVESGWYAGDDIVKTISEMADLIRMRPGLDISPVSEIAVCCETESFFYTRHWLEERPWNGYGIRYSDLFNHWFLNSQNRAWHRIGAPVDFLHREDLTAADLTRYKLIFFPNSFYLKDEDRKRLRKLLDGSGTTAVWYYAPGLLSEDRIDLSQMEHLTGMKFQILEGPGPMMIQRLDDLPETLPERFGIKSTAWYRPRFAVTNEDLTPYGTWADSRDWVAMAKKDVDGWTSIFLGTAPLPPEWLRWLAAQAGVRLWSTRPDIVFATEDAAMFVASGDGDRSVTWHKPMFHPSTGQTSRSITNTFQHGDVCVAHLS